MRSLRHLPTLEEGDASRSPARRRRTARPSSSAWSHIRWEHRREPARLSLVGRRSMSLPRHVRRRARLALPARSVRLDRAVDAAASSAGCSTSERPLPLRILAAIGGHVLGILVPRSWTEALGISELALPLASCSRRYALGCRGSSPASRSWSTADSASRAWCDDARSDLVLYRVLVVVIFFGMLATVWGTLIDRYAYRETGQPLAPRDLHPPAAGDADGECVLHLPGPRAPAWLLFAV